jgi:hypothetical protein
VDILWEPMAKFSNNFEDIFSRAHENFEEQIKVLELSATIILLLLLLLLLTLMRITIIFYY